MTPLPMPEMTPPDTRMYFMPVLDEVGGRASEPELERGRWE